MYSFLFHRDNYKMELLMTTGYGKRSTPRDSVHFFALFETQ
jgi:hypothetical protein